MRKIGYIRVSSESQNLKRQLQQLNEIGMDIIYQGLAPTFPKFFPKFPSRLL